MFNKIRNKYNKLPLPVKASLWFLICSFFQKGISVITTPIFTRLLSVEEYGKYGVFTSWENIINVFVSLNLCYGVYAQGLVKFDNDRKKFTSSMQALTFALLIFWSCSFLIFSDFFSQLLNLPKLYIIMMLLLIWFNSIFGFWASEQRVDYKYKFLVIITVISSMLNPIISIIGIKYLKDKVLGRIMGGVLVGLLLYSWMFVYHLFKGKTFFSKKYWKYALLFNIPLIPHYLSQTILNVSDRIMINSMIGERETGIYNLAYSISLIMTLFNTALLQTISPWVYKKIKEKNIHKITNIGYMTLCLIAFVNLLLIMFAPEIIYIFAPKDYYDAIYIIPPVAMSVYFMFSYDLFAKFEFYYEKTDLISIATTTTAILNIILNYIFIRIYGYIAAGYTTLICYMLYSLFHYIFMKHICKKYCNNVQPYNTKIYLIISSMFLSCGFMIQLLYRFSLIRYIIILIVIIIGLINFKTINSLVSKIIYIKKEENN